MTMTFEERLQAINPQPFADIKEKRIAKGIIQYQNFRTNIALERIDFTGYGKSSAIMLFNTGVAYLNTGNIASRGFGKIKQYIDEMRKQYTPLTPKESERRIKCGGKKRTATIIEPKVNVQPKVTETFIYGVETSKGIIPYQKEEDFLTAVRTLDYVGVEYKKLHLQIEYI